VVITGLGNYSGEAYATYTIEEDTRIDLSGNETKITFDKTDLPYTYDGNEHKPKVLSVTYNNKPLTENVDYTLSYANASIAGNATITATAVEGSKYKGKKQVTYTINKADINDAQITLTPSSYNYTATVIVKTLSENPDESENPITPTEPTTPVDPVDPDPANPDPVAPDPVEPDPVKPDPVNPDPVNPDEPTEPDPSEPGDSTIPAEPGESTDPDPADHGESTTPTEPSDPDEPTNPVDPVEPNEPTEPTEPNTPAAPTEPTEPEVPSQNEGENADNTSTAIKVVVIVFVAAVLASGIFILFKFVILKRK
jgi:hypothetical protein